MREMEYAFVSAAWVVRLTSHVLQDTIIFPEEQRFLNT